MKAEGLRFVRVIHLVHNVAARLGKPATAMSRPIQRLQDMDLVTREQPFAEDPRAGKRALYKISDPFLRFWFRFVDVNRSRLGAGQIAAVEEEIAQRLPHQVGEVWEELPRASVPRLNLTERVWGPVARWWGAGTDRRPLEVDLVALSQDGGSLLVGEVKWAAPRDAGRLLAELEAKARLLPFAAGREVVPMLWLREPVADLGGRVVTPRQALAALR